MSTTSAPNQSLESAQGWHELDQEVDAFLSGKTLLRTDEPGALPIFRPPPLPTSLSGIGLLEELVRRRTWSAVINLSHELLTSSSSPFAVYYSQLIQGRSDQDGDISDEMINEDVLNTIQIIIWRLRAFKYVRRFNDLKMEIVRLRLLPSHIETLPSWVPPLLILEGLESSTYNAGEDQENVMDSICKMRYALLKNKGLKDELLKLDIVMSNIFIRKEEWRLALATLDDVLLYVEDAVQVWMKNMEIYHLETHKEVVDLVTCAFKVEIYSRQGRILLQAGALPEAATVFERAHHTHQTMRDENDDLSGAHISTKNSDYITLAIVRNIPTQILLNEGLLHFAHLDYDLAQEKFTRAIEMQRRESIQASQLQSKLSSRNLFYEIEILNSEGNLLIPCLNNLSLSSLYTCRMHEAVAMLEALIREDATKYLTECIAFNLCTMYELGHDTATSNQKKTILHRVATRFCLDDVGQECFRLG
jgi:tetratricopeptide (TPR) repeat protein